MSVGGMYCYCFVSMG